MKWSRGALCSSEGTSRGSDTKRGQQGGVAVCQGLGWGRRGRGSDVEYSADGCDKGSAKTAHAYGQGWWYRRGMHRPVAEAGAWVGGVGCRACMDRRGPPPLSGQTMCAAAAGTADRRELVAEDTGAGAYEIGGWCGAAVVVHS